MLTKGKRYDNLYKLSLRKRQQMTELQISSNSRMRRGRQAENKKEEKKFLTRNESFDRL